MTYATRVSDAQFLDILSMAGRHGGLTMVHAENHDMLDWMGSRLVNGGNLEPRYHAPSRPGLAEEEAINRAISLARLADAPLFIVHVNTRWRRDHCESARCWRQGLGRDVPQYLFSPAMSWTSRGWRAKFICSPPLRDVATQEALWQHVQAGTLSLVSSDHAPYRYDDTGKFNTGRDINFRQIANGMPGSKCGCLLFSKAL